uniref:DUF3291 domain-containing protein n=1 Tax=Cyclophora tenuis TaxID=216820 RepID=A0A7S1D0U1_CYCTE|mmetsp:Transcript_15646/g.26497  ORF Transcript_15646/g.26497 Transcript_15646/m.26497 type:complete len:154 (+) Transcript_15646:59-520(+)
MVSFGNNNSHQYYVSITGLRLKSFWSYFSFGRHAVGCYTEAMSTEGNVLTDTKQIDGVHHTLTAWESREAMRKFMLSDTHRKAMKAFPTIATGKTYGYWTDHIPNWEEAREIWELNGREYSTSKSSTTTTPRVKVAVADVEHDTTSVIQNSPN